MISRRLYGLAPGGPGGKNRSMIRSLIACSASVMALLPLHSHGAEVALDVGHHLEAPGAISSRGRPEFEFNRDLALEIGERLRRQGVMVRMIGEDGSVAQLEERVRRGSGAAFFLSIHHDSTQARNLLAWQHEGVERLYAPDRFAGFSLFVSRRNPRLAQSRACASAIGERMLAAGFTRSLYHAEQVAGEARPFADRANGVHYYDNLAVLRGAAMPAVLFEAGVILNRDEELQLADPARRSRMAQAVADGVQRCLERVLPAAKRRAARAAAGWPRLP